MKSLNSYLIIEAKKPSPPDPQEFATYYGEQKYSEYNCYGCAYMGKRSNNYGKILDDILLPQFGDRSLSYQLSKTDSSYKPRLILNGSCFQFCASRNSKTEPLQIRVEFRIESDKEFKMTSNDVNFLKRTFNVDNKDILVGKPAIVTTGPVADHAGGSMFVTSIEFVIDEDTAQKIFD